MRYTIEKTQCVKIVKFDVNISKIISEPVYVKKHSNKKNILQENRREALKSDYHVIMLPLQR